MIDTSTLTSILPAILSAIATYFVAERKNRNQQVKIISDIQIKSFEVIRVAEERMRLEIKEELNSVRSELNVVKEENDKLRRQIVELTSKLKNGDDIISMLKDEIVSLRSIINNYEDRIHTLTEYQRKDEERNKNDDIKKGI